MGPPKPNAHGTYLPMLWRGERRIENERLRYREAQRLHHKRFPDYVGGWRRPAKGTAARVWSLVKKPAAKKTGGLSDVERQALVIALDAAIQAGQDGRLLTHNLIFYAVATAWSDHYRIARERGPARISWEMSPDTLKGAWRDLLRNNIRLEKLIAVAQHGCGLYGVTKGRDDKYSVDLTIATTKLREKFLETVAKDEATGGTYKRRSSLRRLRVADRDADDVIVDEQETDEVELLDDATTRKVVAEVEKQGPSRRGDPRTEHRPAARRATGAHLGAGGPKSGRHPLGAHEKWPAPGRAAELRIL
jgi:hypothetical protein